MRVNVKASNKKVNVKTGFVGVSGGSGYIYTDDAIWFDSVSGEAGTTEPIGTAQHPSNNLADVRTMLAARKLTKIQLPISSSGLNTATLDADMPFKAWIGQGK